MLTLLAVLGILLLIMVLLVFVTSFAIIIEYVIPAMAILWVASLCYKIIRKWFKSTKKEGRG